MKGQAVMRKEEFILTTVTPALARQWLSGSTWSNRPVNQEFVQHLANEMLAGRWKVTHQGLALSGSPPQVLDGQHRLHAVIKSGCTIMAWVAWNVVDSKDAGGPIDQGKIRSLAHLMTMRDSEITNASTRAAVVRMVAKLVLPEQQLTATLAPLQAFEVADQYANEIEVVIEEICRSTPKPTAAMMAPFVLELRADEVSARLALGHLHSGAGLEYSDPLLFFRNRWLADRGTRQGGQSQLLLLALCIGALDARRNGERSLRSARGEYRYRRWCSAVGIAVNEHLATSFRESKGRKDAEA